MIRRGRCPQRGIADSACNLPPGTQAGFDPEPREARCQADLPGGVPQGRSLRDTDSYFEGER